ncbi:MAG: MarR family winged helix-turn-helix transcriptional regulator [Micromonosporaceae bacterium]
MVEDTVMVEETEASKLDHEIFNALSEFIGQMLVRGGKLADQFGVPFFCFKAMHWLEGGMAMKELGRRMRCDPSFVTSIADLLEKRGLARREPNPADRRIKNLVLTTEGFHLKAEMERAMLADMPWCSALDAAERKSFLAMVRKLVTAEAAAASNRTPPQTGGECAGEVIDELTAASAGGD